MLSRCITTCCNVVACKVVEGGKREAKYRDGDVDSMRDAMCVKGGLGLEVRGG